jgi:predicted RNase H-like HicB family nuclease
MSKQIIHKGKNFTNAVINVLVGKQEDYYIAYCPALELSSYGKTEDQARKNFEVELEIFIEETGKRGSLEKVLLKLGWCLTQSPSPTYVPPKLPNYSVSISHPQTYSETVALPF